MARKTVSVKCDSCGKDFEKLLSSYNNSIKRGDKHTFCSPRCKHNKYMIGKKYNCKQCSKEIYVIPAIIRQRIKNAKIKNNSCSENYFCCSSCSCTYNNAHKLKGTRRSKSEIYLEKKIKEKYPDWEIHFNRKDAINSELDIYIPGLKLAIEINGILHYMDVFGEKKFKAIQSNDARKSKLCKLNGINLKVIDTFCIRGSAKQVDEITLDRVLYAIEEVFSSLGNELIKEEFEEFV